MTLNDNFIVKHRKRKNKSVLKQKRKEDDFKMNLCRALETTKGKLFELSSYEDLKIKKYLKRELSDTDMAILYIDTAHMLTEPIVKSMIYCDLYDYRDIIKLLSLNEEQPDLIILDNFGDIANKPRESFALFNMSRIVSGKKYNLLFVNQVIYNFGYDKESRRYIPQYDKLYKRYCSFRQIIYGDTAKTTLNKIKSHDIIKTYGLSIG